MALTHCPECKKEISSTAKSCPHCGYHPKKKGCITYVLYLFGAIFLLFIITNKCAGSASNIIDDTRTYDQSWRSPNVEELREISRLMIKNNVSGCGEYHIKEIENSEFVVACTVDGKNWTYYVAWPNVNKIYLASEEMENKLIPPY